MTEWVTEHLPWMALAYALGALMMDRVHRRER